MKNQYRDATHVVMCVWICGEWQRALGTYAVSRILLELSWINLGCLAAWVLIERCSGHWNQSQGRWDIDRAGAQDSMGEARTRASSPRTLAAGASRGGWFGGLLQTKLRGHARFLEGQQRWQRNGMDGGRCVPGGSNG